MSEFTIKYKKPSPFGNAEFVYVTFKDHFFVLKVAEAGEPSDQGVNGTPIISLTICPGDEWDGANQVFNFDRGLDFTSIGFDLAIELVDAFCEKHDYKRIGDIEGVCPTSQFPQEVDSRGCPINVE
jgi:hypothetical protein